MAGTHSGRGWAIALLVAESVPALILATVIVLLAGPQQLSAPRTKRVLTNIEFCVDISSSMTTPAGRRQPIRCLDEGDRSISGHSQRATRSD